MSAEKDSRLILGVCAGIGFSIALALALTLLMFSKLSGSEFTAFVLAFAVLAVAVGFAPEVQEISIAGNVVKLKEVKAEALKAIESLNKSRIEMLRVFLGLALRHGGGFAAETPVDPRVNEFWHLVRQAKEYGCTKELKEEFLDGVNTLLWAQQYNIYLRNRDERLALWETYLDPLDLAPIAFNEAGIALAESSRSPAPDNYREEIKEALAEYSKLFEFKRSLESIQ